MPTPNEIIEHCASLAVAYMQDQPSWDGTAADCGYLRDAIVNGDHSAIIDAAPIPTQQVLRGERDWPEDFASENGNYECICYECGQHFIGHKRRIVCRKCHMDLSDIDKARAVLNERKSKSQIKRLKAQRE